MNAIVAHSIPFHESPTHTAAQIAPAHYAPDQNPALIYLASLAPGSRRAMSGALETIAGLLTGGAVGALGLPWGELRYQHTQAIRSKLGETYSPATVNKLLSALRGVLKTCWRLDQMAVDDYQRAIDLGRVKGETAAQAEKGRHLTQGEFGALLRVCADGSAGGARDASIIAVGYVAGLRRAELAALMLDDLCMEKCTLTVRRGKGRKERVIPMAPGACDALADWLHFRGPWAGPLFTRVLKGDHVTLDGITDQTIFDMLARRAKAAGVKAFSPHDLRRTFAGDLLDAGADISTVQKLMGHASVTTTARYDRRDAKAKRQAVNKLHLPYRRQFTEV